MQINRAIGSKLQKLNAADKKWNVIGDRKKEVAKLGVRYYGGNFHTNFVDLNPSWA